MSKSRKRTKVLSDFENFCGVVSRGEGRSSSIATHVKNIRTLIDSFGLPLTRPTHEDIKQVVAKRLQYRLPHQASKKRALTKKRISNNAFNSNIQSLRIWLRFHDIDPSTPPFKDYLHSKRREARRIKTADDLLTPDSIQKVVDYHKHPVWKALTAVLWDTGARPSELCSVDYSDVKRDQHGYVLHIKESKSKTRSLRLVTPIGMKYFQYYFTQHARSGPLFINTIGRRVTKNCINSVYRGASEKIGFRIWPTLFRKSASTYWKRESIFDDTAIRRRLGHLPWSKTFERHYHQYYDEDYEEAELRAMGVIPEREPGPEKGPCWNCGFVTETGLDTCPNCNQPLDETILARTAKVTELEEQVRQLEDRLGEANKERKQIIQEILADPSTLDQLSEIVASRLSSAVEDGQEP